MINKYSFNNEAIGLISFIETLKHCRKIKLANCLLILPFILHPSISLQLSDKRTSIRSIEEFTTKASKYFTNFPVRFESLLPVSLNCLIIAIETGLINLENGYASPTEKINDFANTNDIGNRAKQIVKASKRLALLLQEDSSNLFLHLRIKL